MILDDARKEFETAFPTEAETLKKFHGNTWHIEWNMNSETQWLGSSELLWLGFKTGFFKAFSKHD